MGQLKVASQFWCPRGPGSHVKLGSSAAEGEVVADEAVGPLLTPGTSARGAEHDPKVPDPRVQVCCRHVNSSAMLGWCCAQADWQGLSAGAALLPGSLLSVPALPMLPHLPWLLAHRELICSPVLSPMDSPIFSLRKEMHKAGYNPPLI